MIKHVNILKLDRKIRGSANQSIFPQNLATCLIKTDFQMIDSPFNSPTFLLRNQMIVSANTAGDIFLTTNNKFICFAFITHLKIKPAIINIEAKARPKNLLVIYCVVD